MRTPKISLHYVLGGIDFSFPQSWMPYTERMEFTAHFAAMRDRGVERIYAWFADFAVPETLTLFGERVIAQLA